MKFFNSEHKKLVFEELELGGAYGRLAREWDVSETMSKYISIPRFGKMWNSYTDHLNL